jgi:hypothetical protein
MTRGEFYESSPKEIKSLFNIHLDFQGINIEKDNGYKDNEVYTIDQIPWL